MFSSPQLTGTDLKKLIRVPSLIRKTQLPKFWGEYTLYGPSTSDSLELVGQCLLDAHPHRRIWIPGFICDSALTFLRAKWRRQICFYPQDSDLIPEWIFL